MELNTVPVREHKSDQQTDDQRSQRKRRRDPLDFVGLRQQHLLGYSGHIGPPVQVGPDGNQQSAVARGADFAVFVSRSFGEALGFSSPMPRDGIKLPSRSATTAQPPYWSTMFCSRLPI